MIKLADQSGNSLLEMLLFTPLALMLLFVATDLGMAFKDRSSIIDAARMALNSHAASLNALELEESGEFFSNASQETLLSELTNRLENYISRARGLNSSPPEFKPFIRAAIVSAEVDAQTGKLNNMIVSPSSLTRNEEMMNHCENQNIEEYVSTIKNEDSPRTVSLFSTPKPTGLSNTADRFRNRTFLVALQICGRTRGLTDAQSYGIMNKYFTYSEVQLSVLRNQPSQMGSF